MADDDEIRILPKDSETGYDPGWYCQFVRDNRLEKETFLGGQYPDQNEWFTVTVRAVSPVETEVLIDGDSIGSFDPGAFISGGAGVLAGGDGYVDIDDVSVRANDEYLEQWRRPGNLSTFAWDPYMAYWAAGAASDISENVLWLSDGPFDDSEVRFSGSKQMTAWLYSPDRSKGGVKLDYDPDEELMSVTHEGEQLTAFSLSPGSLEKGITVNRVADRALVRVGKTILGSFTIPEGVGKGYFCLAVQEGQTRPDPKVRFSVSSPQLFIDDFVHSPASWDVLGGVWGTTTRWSCDPRWSYFGGYGDNAVIASKHYVSGDCYFDLFIAPPMLSHAAPWEVRSDFVLGLVEDPTDMFGGFVVHLAAEQDHQTRLYYDGELVATHDMRVFESTTFERNAQPVHKWYRVRLEISDGVFRFLLDGKEIFTQKSTGKFERLKGVVGAVENGVLVSHVRLSGEALNSSPHGSGANFMPHAELQPSRLSARTRITPLKRGVRAETVSSIGVPVLNYAKDEVQLEKTPYLTFSFARKNTPADLYFRCNGFDMKLNMTGGADQAGSSSRSPTFSCRTSVSSDCCELI
ncbi:MAG: hypothetical protein U5N86_11625 [Planctomycetota bacterium]|nr:hypothetical protein [Planctomycetota bacterium]